MASHTERGRSARVEWVGDELQISVSGAAWSVPRDALSTVIHLLQAGSAMATSGSHDEVPAAATAMGDEAAPGSALRKKRRSRKRVGDALIVWMEQNPGWHHEEELLEIVIEHRMTDATPRRALKIALGKQRGVLFSDRGDGYWKLVTDPTPEPLSSTVHAPTLRQRIVSTSASSAMDGAPMAPAVAVTPHGVTEQPKESAGQERPRDERWTGVSSAEVARARRNLLGLGSAS